MKRERKFRLVALILPILMLIQAFFLAPAGLAEGEEKDGSIDKLKYTINLDIKIIEKGDEPSGRQVKVWQVPEDKLEKNASGDIDLLKTAQKYDKIDEKAIKEELNDELLLSEESKFTEDGDKERITFEIEQEKDKVFYYLIKESEDSYEKIRDRIENGPSERLNTSVIKVPSESFNENALTISLKGNKPEEPEEDITLIKEDSKNPDKKIEKVNFRLLVKSNSEDKKVYPVILEQKSGYYEFKAIDKGTEEKPADKKTATVLTTNADGKIIVRKLPKLSKDEAYYFEEIEAVGIYKEFNNILNNGKLSKEFDNTIKEEIVVENDRIPFVKKTDTKGKLLEKVGFKVYNKEGKALKFKKDKGENIGDYGYGYIYDDNGDEEVFTDKDGNIFLGKMPAGEDYYFLETTPLKDYKESEEKYYFNVDENGVIYIKDKDNKKIQKTLVIKNIPIKPQGGNEKNTGGRKFIKVDKNDSKIKVKEAKFMVLKKVGDKYADIDEDNPLIVESDKDGRFEVKDLPYEGEGTTYYLKEFSAPGYIVNSDPIPFAISATSYPETHQVITNEKQPPTPPKEETPPPTPPTPPETPSTPTKTLTSRSRGPLVKTGDVRIWIYFAIGILMIVAGFIIIRNQDKKQELA